VAQAFSLVKLLALSLINFCHRPKIGLYWRFPPFSANNWGFLIFNLLSMGHFDQLPVPPPPKISAPCSATAAPCSAPVPLKTGGVWGVTPFIFGGFPGKAAEIAEQNIARPEGGEPPAPLVPITPLLILKFPPAPGFLEPIYQKRRHCARTGGTIGTQKLAAEEKVRSLEKLVILREEARGRGPLTIPPSNSLPQPRI